MNCPCPPPPEKRARYVAEFLGTMLLVLVIKLASAYGFIVTPLAIGFSLVMIVYTFGYVSTAHFNPSVTLAFWIRDCPAFPRSDLTQTAMYLLAEYLGALAGGFLAYLIGDKSAALAYPHTPTPHEDYFVQAFFGEIVFTWLLCTTILHVATAEKQAGNQFYGLAIGLSLMAGAVCIGPISGACLNSAVWLGTVIPALIADNGDGAVELDDAWIYWTAPFIGGALAGLLYNLVFKFADSDGAKPGVVENLSANIRNASANGDTDDL